MLFDHRKKMVIIRCQIMAMFRMLLYLLLEMLLKLLVAMAECSHALPLQKQNTFAGKSRIF
jgi:hypothetical protein